VLSAPVRGEVAGGLPDGVELEALGAWRFRGLPEPIAMFQARAADLASGFPPLRSAEPVAR
jgi:hypothetical protein